MTDLTRVWAVAVLAYGLGSLPFALWVTRWRTGEDIRQVGSGHAGATNTMRRAGWGAAVLVLAADVLKGWLPLAIALDRDLPGWAFPLIGGLVVVGHCWPVWAGFHGGMGLAPAAGALVAFHPLIFVISLGVVVALVLALRHSARAVVVAAPLTPMALVGLGFQGVEVWLVAVVGGVVGVRFLRDWNRKYRELWLDRGD